jgi:hypothetical protein
MEAFVWFVPVYWEVRRLGASYLSRNRYLKI